MFALRNLILEKFYCHSLMMKVIQNFFQLPKNRQREREMGRGSIMLKHKIDSFSFHAAMNILSDHLKYYYDERKLLLLCTIFSFWWFFSFRWCWWFDVLSQKLMRPTKHPYVLYNRIQVEKFLSNLHNFEDFDVAFKWPKMFMSL